MGESALVVGPHLAFFQTEVTCALGAGKESARIVKGQLRNHGSVFCATKRG